MTHLMITTIPTLYAHAESEHENNGLSGNKTEKRMSKREAAIFIDNFPMEPMYQHRPKVIYRRISKQRYQSPKPKYGPPTKYRSVKPWKPSKKYRRTVKPKYGPPSYKRYPSKPKYGPPKPKIHKLVYGPPKKIPLSSFYPPEPIGFGEPPMSNVEFQHPKQSFGEPPLDSYGEPLNTAVKDIYISEQFPPQATNLPDTFINFDDFNANFGQDYKSWQDYHSNQNQNFDNSIAYSKVRPVYVKPDHSFTTPDEDFDMKNRYLHNYKHREFHRERKPLPFENKIASHNVNKKITSKSQRPPKKTSPEPEEVLVGGRYAEPPERYVPKLTIAQYSDDDDFTPLKGYIDPDVAISATMSPYVNYKNSNMAFSPQNLNDAFSIVDK
ncbi:jg23308 [Pararge aegeria aegeria]|uniref:Jg23308 protein n=1 Tax=Pararge aegeria aegeria TaxID=348720 RepID=A0A8S4RCS9_9NEOP|nr:jg23308 [Pararge aegeria aegeria]